MELWFFFFHSDILISELNEFLLVKFFLVLKLHTILHKCLYHLHSTMIKRFLFFYFGLILTFVDFLMMVILSFN